MDATEPADFYTGIVVDVYGPLRGSTPDWRSCAAFMDAWGGPGLELGCGDGDPLLTLRSEGLDVEGLDSSADMLAKLRDNAEVRGVDVTTHHATIENMDLGRSYRSIFLAGPTFNLIADDATAVRALERIRAHLDPRGAALVPLFIPEPVLDQHIGIAREHVDERGRTLRVTVTATERDELARRQVTMLRYEIVEGESRQSLERPWILHWHTQAGFAELVSRAGLRTAAVRTADGEPAPPDATSFEFVLRRTDSPST